MVLCEKNSIVGVEKDKIIASLILHDSCKAGIEEFENHSNYPAHAYLPREHFSKVAQDFTEIASEIFAMIDSHMGEWSTREEKIPQTRNERIVHFADYLASRKNQPILDFNAEIRPLRTYDDSIVL